MCTRDQILEDCAQIQTCRAKALMSESVVLQVLHHASYVARPAIVLECSAYVCVSECMLFGLTARCIVVPSLQLPERSLQLPCFCYLTLLSLFLSMSRRCLCLVQFHVLSILCAVHPCALYTHFLCHVPAICSCVMLCDVYHAYRFFYPLCIPLRAIYSDVMCALMCFRELFITVLCLFPVL